MLLEHRIFALFILVTTSGVVATMQSPTTSDPHPHSHPSPLSPNHDLPQIHPEAKGKKNGDVASTETMTGFQKAMRREVEALVRRETEALREETRRYTDSLEEQMRREMKALVKTETEELQNRMRQEVESFQSVARALMAENRDLRKQLQDLGLQLVRQSPQDQATGRDPAVKGDVPWEDQHRAGNLLPGQGRPVSDSIPAEDLRRTLYRPENGPSLQQSLPKVQTRSDDSGPLEVVVNNLSQVTSQMTSDIQALQTSVTQQSRDLQAAKGATYVHWGSSSCTAASAQLVYSGVVGGSFYHHTGAAANALCLSMTPHAINKSPDIYAELYGGEYETHDSHMNADPVCAVCKTPHPTSVMVPGTDACPAGWTRQYWGYLMAGRDTYEAASEFICVDNKMEAAVRSEDNHNGYLLHYTKAVCGSLPCPPYQNGKVVSCVVCAQ